MRYALLFVTAKNEPEVFLVGKNLFSALSDSGEEFALFDGAKDIWARDYMPVKTKSGKYVSFRYEPNYLADDPQLRTNFKADIAPRFALPVTYSDINLDGGNVVFSPSRTKAVITDRVFSENPEYDKNTLTSMLEKLLEAEIVIIPSYDRPCRRRGELCERKHSNRQCLALQKWL